MNSISIRLFSTVAVSSTLMIGACADDETHEPTWGLDGSLPADASQSPPDSGVDPTNDAAAAPADAATDLDAGASCKLDQRYRFTSGSLLNGAEFELTPGGKFRRDAPLLDGGRHCEQGQLSCEQVNAAVAALRDEDVLAAYSPDLVLYGVGFSLASDFAAVRITRADGQGFQVGDRCGSDAACRAIPEGLIPLRSLLGQLRDTALTETCSSD